MAPQHHLFHSYKWNGMKVSQSRYILSKQQFQFYCDHWGVVRVHLFGANMYVHMIFLIGIQLVTYIGNIILIYIQMNYWLILVAMVAVFVIVSTIA